jgi:hypothetical protein
MSRQTSYTLHDGRTFQAVREATGCVINLAPEHLIFIKEGERHVQLDEQSRLAFNDDAFSAWLKAWRN